jgi:hypothetical protein
MTAKSPVVRFLAALAVAFSVVAGVSTAVAATPNVGQHIHIEVANHPVDGYPIPRADWTFQVTIKLHNQTGTATQLRIDDASTIKQTWAMSLGPCSDCVLGPFQVVVHFGTWSAGRHEIHWHVDVPKNDQGNRQFTTARSQICLASCTPNGVNGRPTPYNGGGSWYLGQYATITDLSPDTNVHPGGSIVIKAAQNATTACGFLNPDFHNGNHGTLLGCWADTARHTITIPLAAVPGDRLVLYASQANGNAGLFRLTVGDGSVRTVQTYEYQSWWAKGGVVLP